ncbi:MAG: phosphate ABC transporter substrate-binding protein PstS [Candidatus Nitrosopolaris sp.]
MQNQLLIGLIAVAMLSAMIVSASASQKSYSQKQLTINGAGATFPFPVIDTWRVAYQKVHPNVNINYQSIGSGDGVRQFAAKTVDFGASDTPLTAEERQAVPGVVQIPETIESVVVAYNIPGIPTKMLKFTGPVLVDIFQGKITKWNDPRIKALNTGVSLPDTNIVVVHRSDGSGTNYVWTSYLSSQSRSWNQTVGFRSQLHGQLG